MPQVDSTWIVWSIVLLLVSLLVSLGVLWLVIVLLPADYFVEPKSARRDKAGSRGVGRWALRIAKNMAGALLVLAGLVMMVTPGQGILSILVGIMLLDVPGKRSLELRLLRRPRIERTITRVRKQVGRPPLELPPDDEE